MIIDLLFRSDIEFLRKIIMVAVFAFAILIALVLHEVAHGFAALKQGDSTAKLAGRLSLNPARHIEPLGLLCFFLAGFGWAKPVPVNPFKYKNFRRGNFLVSVAGILVNFVLGLVFSLLLYITIKFGGPITMDSNLALWAVHWFLYFGTVINVSLMIFNLLPIYPLDGYNMLVSLTKPNNKYMNFVRQYGSWIFLGVLLVSMWFGVIADLRDGIIWCFNSLWGLMF